MPPIQEHVYFLSVTVKQNCHCMIRIGDGEWFFYSVPKDLVGEEAMFTEKQYNDAGGQIRENMAKALIRKCVREESGDMKLKISFLTAPDWIDSHVRSETYLVEDPDKPTYRRNPDTNELEILNDIGEYEVYYD